MRSNQTKRGGASREKGGREGQRQVDQHTAKNIAAKSNWWDWHQSAHFCEEWFYGSRYKVERGPATCPQAAEDNSSDECVGDDVQV